jgi:hypothetical protein
VNANADAETAAPAQAAWTARQSSWSRGWRRLVFPGVLLVYLIYVADAVSTYASGATAVLCYCALVVFAGCYLVVFASMPDFTQAGRKPSRAELWRFWALYGVMVALFVAELPWSRAAGFVMCLYLTIVAVGRLGRRSVPFVLAMTLAAIFVPAAVPSWHNSLASAFTNVTPVAIPVVALSVYGALRAHRDQRQVDPSHHELFGWVVREGLTNIVRHAHASTCAIRLSASSVEIVDDGVGGTAPPGNGLSGLRERVAAAGGVVDAGPLLPRGWRLRVSLAPGGGT